nr:MAG TPA: hypothetical protein [Caudoviricetes sp.]DAU59333.1 MAG TPA: hypothetical protein [Crassvirales sp.]
MTLSHLFYWLPLNILNCLTLICGGVPPFKDY